MSSELLQEHALEGRRRGLEHRRGVGAAPADTAATAGIRFDWYAASFRSFDDWHEIASRRFGLSVRHVKGARGYPVGWELFDADGVQIRAYRRDGREWYVELHGTRCASLVPAFRRLVPTHNVSRADAALDFVGDYSAVATNATEWARNRGLSWRKINNSDGGETLYLGAASAEAMIRIYRKTEELRSRGVPDVLENIVRIELQLRPKSCDKEKIGTVSAAEMWGYTRTTRHFLEDFAGYAAEPLQLRIRKKPAMERALEAMAAQYSKTVSQLREEQGENAAAAYVLELLGFELAELSPDGGQVAPALSQLSTVGG